MTANQSARERAWLIFIALFFIIALFGANAHAARRKIKKPPSTDRGCYVTYNPTTGQFLREPFQKTRDKESFSEGGETEIWGFKPWSQNATKDGHPIEVNVLASRFVPLGTSRTVPAGATKRMVHCPPAFW